MLDWTFIYSNTCNTFRFLILGVLEIAIMAAVHFRTLDDESERACECGRFIMRDFSSGWCHFVAVTESRVLNIGDFTWNYFNIFEKYLQRIVIFFLNKKRGLLSRQTGLSGFQVPLLLHLTVLLPTLSRWPSEQVMLSTTPTLKGSLAFFPTEATWILVSGSSIGSGAHVSFVPSFSHRRRELVFYAAK